RARRAAPALLKASAHPLPASLSLSNPSSVGAHQEESPAARAGVGNLRKTLMKALQNDRHHDRSAPRFLSPSERVPFPAPPLLAASASANRASHLSVQADRNHAGRH